MVSSSTTSSIALCAATFLALSVATGVTAQNYQSAYKAPSGSSYGLPATYTNDWYSEGAKQASDSDNPDNYVGKAPKGACQGNRNRKLVRATTSITLSTTLKKSYNGDCKVYLMNEDYSGSQLIAQKKNCGASANSSWKIDLPGQASGKKIIRWTWDVKRPDGNNCHVEQCHDVVISKPSSGTKYGGGSRKNDDDKKKSNKDKNKDKKNNDDDDDSDDDDDDNSTYGPGSGGRNGSNGSYGRGGNSGNNGAYGSNGSTRGNGSNRPKNNNKDSATTKNTYNPSNTYSTNTYKV
ncbi:hypothetical protein BDF19DRAFT_437918 [Syncephalis fuscata]|nr:hypothetical protein BDF19DRAFT_437918 [Syncephalis fuscata]